MERITRFGVSIEPELLEEFDTLIKKRGYGSRSEAIRDLIRKDLNEEKVKERKGKVVGIVAFLYNHHEGDVAEKLLEVQHHNAKGSFTAHVHVDEENCLEILIVQGDAEEIKSLADRIKSIKGVKYSEVLMASPEIA